MEVSLGLIALLVGALLVLLVALGIGYSDRIRYKLLPPKCQICGTKEDVRRFYKNFNPTDPRSLDVEFLCPECEKQESKEHIERLIIREQPEEKDKGEEQAREAE